MSTDYRHGSHTISRLSAHIVFVTKYRKKVLTGDIQIRCRDIIKQVCDAEDVRILKGAVSKDHVHMLIEYRPSLSISDFVKRVKGRSSRLLQQEFLSPALEREHFYLQKIPVNKILSSP